MIPKRKTLTTTQAARLASISPSTMLRAAQAGQVKAFKTPGGHFRVDPNSLKNFVPKSWADGPSDKDLLDWLQAQNNKKSYTGRCLFRWSSQGRGWRFHETSEGVTSSVRTAIIMAMEQEKNKDGGRS